VKSKDELWGPIGGSDRTDRSYRSDTTAGLRIGERIATSVLRDRLRQRPAGAYGSRGAFEFTTFDGTEITLTADGVDPADAFDPSLY